MAVAGLGGVLGMLALGQPGHVHRAGVRHRQPGPPQAGSGQEQGDGKGAAPPEEAKHGR
jgi:hypothetical protein